MVGVSDEPVSEAPGVVFAVESVDWLELLVPADIPEDVGRSVWSESVVVLGGEEDTVELEPWLDVVPVA